MLFWREQSDFGGGTDKSKSKGRVGDPPLGRWSCKCLTAVNVDLNLDARAETIDDRNEAVEGEAAQVGVADAGEVGGGNAGLRVGGADGELFPVQHFDDFGCEDGL